MVTRGYRFISFPFMNLLSFHKCLTPSGLSLLTTFFFVGSKVLDCYLLLMLTPIAKVIQRVQEERGHDI